MINHVFISFSAVQIHNLSFIITSINKKSVINSESQICPGLNANEIQIPYDKHHKVFSLKIKNKKKLVRCKYLYKYIQMRHTNNNNNKKNNNNNNNNKTTNYNSNNNNKMTMVYRINQRALMSQLIHGLGHEMT